jgi:hypothetical protein
MLNDKIVAIKKFKDSDDDDEHVSLILSKYIGKKDSLKRDQSTQKL